MKQLQETRMELLNLSKRQATIVHAKKLLEKKQKILMQEIVKIVGQVFTGQSELISSSLRSRYALSQAEAVLGEEVVLSAGLATDRRFPFDFRMDNVMGVFVPEFELKIQSRAVMERGYSLTNTSLLIDEVAETAETEVNAIIRLANSELRLKRLLTEYQRTSRRLNAFEHLILPQIQTQMNQIQLALEERERFDYYRLKLVKKIINR